MVWQVTTKTSQFEFHTDITDGWELLERLAEKYPETFKELIMIERAKR